MSNREVLNILKSNPEQWYSAKDLMGINGWTYSNIQNYVHTLFRQGYVEKKIEEKYQYGKSNTYYRYKQ